MPGGASALKDDRSFREAFKAPELRQRHKTKVLTGPVLVPDNKDKDCRDFTMKGIGSIWIRLNGHVIRLWRDLPTSHLEIFKGEDVEQDPCQTIDL